MLFKNLILIIVSSFTISSNYNCENSKGENELKIEKDSIDILHVSGTIYMLRPDDKKIGNPSSVVSIGEDGVLLVDAGISKLGPLIMKKIKELGGKNVDIILTTHYHADHTDGLQFFGSDALKIATKNQRKRFLTEGLFSEDDFMKKEGLPDITFDTSFSIYYNGEEIQVSTFPNKSGHTDGDLYVYFTKSKVLCIGDYLFLDKFPIIDIDGGGDFENYFKNIDYLLNTFPNDTKIIPGHGNFRPKEIKFVSMREFKTNIESLQYSIQIIRNKINQGFTLEKIKEEGLPEKYTSYGVRPRYVSINRWIEAVFNYYKEKS